MCHKIVKHGANGWTSQLTYYFDDNPVLGYMW